LDGRGYASLDGFIIDVSNFQDSSYSAAAHGFLIRSIGAHTRGVEGEAQFQATHWLQFYGNFAYTPTARLADGERMQRAPVFTDVVGARLSTPLTKDWDFAANVELNHSSSFYNQPPLAPGDNLSGGYSIVDARIAVIDRPAHLELSISASNLNDAVYREFTFGAPLGGTVGILNRPRTITFTVKKGF
jgi:hypothetical protein